jgi:hypothetical protein
LNECARSVSGRQSAAHLDDAKFRALVHNSIKDLGAKLN